jgi:hypothetical protein
MPVPAGGTLVSVVDVPETLPRQVSSPPPLGHGVEIDRGRAPCGRMESDEQKEQHR